MTSFPSRRRLWWIASPNDQAGGYRVETSKNGGDWQPIGFVYSRPNQWDYSLETEDLDDLAKYTWRIIPVGPSGADGQARVIQSETIVRTPDGPDFQASYDGETNQITFVAR